MTDATVVRLRGEGGVVWDFELPLSEVYEDQVKQRKLIPDDDESRDALASLLAAPAAESDDADSGADPVLGLAQRIRSVASHAEANALADELGVDGFEDKKPGLDDKRAALLEAAAAKAAE